MGHAQLLINSLKAAFVIDLMLIDARQRQSRLKSFVPVIRMP
jgi:hypothetical protein